MKKGVFGGYGPFLTSVLEDVVENEFGLYYYDKKTEVMDNRELAILKSFPNVVVTPHMAFYTNEAIHDMVYSSIKSCALDSEGKDNPWRVG